MIQEILAAIQTQFKADPGLTSITKYDLVDGMLPGVTKPAISISCERLKYEDYDVSQDEVIAPIRIYVYLRDMKADRGESAVRSLSESVRYALLSDPYLGGLVAWVTVKDVTFMSDDAKDSMMLHLALMECEAKFYAPRQRPPGDIPTVAEIDVIMNTEEQDIQL